jgi:hypothetical protein
MEILNNDLSKNLPSGGFYVYKGLDKATKELVYIGTTVQKPADRFRWHKANGKDLEFHVIASLPTGEEMLDLEYELITKLKPKLNKIVKRKQNLNVRLTPEILASRVGNSEWCQSCLRRRVNRGYTKCMYCK